MPTHTHHIDAYAWHTCPDCATRYFAPRHETDSPLCLDCWLDAERDELEHLEESGE